MSQLTSYAYIRGLNLNSNPLYGEFGKDVYGGPRSAVQVADNCVLSRQHMIGNRRGFDYFTNPTSALVDAMFEYQNYIIQHQSDNTLWYGDNSSGTRTQYSGQYTVASGYRMDATVSSGSLFLTALAGPQKLDSVTATPHRSGITKGLDTRGSMTGTGNGFMSGFARVAYHVTWIYTDANSLEVRSDVSARCVVTSNNRVTVSSLTSTGGTATCTTATAHGFSTGDSVLISGAAQTAYNGTQTITVTSSTAFTYSVAGSPTSPATGTITAEKYQNVSLSFTVPWDLPSGCSYEIWRTVSVDASNADPGDTCYLVTSAPLTASAGATVTYVDTTPDTNLASAQALYTNATQEGALQGNARPPVATCIADYKNYLIVGNTAIDHQITVELLAVINLVSGTSAITITPATGTATTYTFGASEDVGTRTAQLYTGGTSNAADIELTARSLCHVINGDSSSAIYAEYTSGSNDNPGIMRFWARSPLSGAFSVTASDSTTGNQFSPTLPTSGSAVVSSNDARPNRLFVSKLQQPDAVPVLNTVDIGRRDQAILGIIPVQDACYVIKQDGVWYLSGLDYPFSLIELDSTCRCVAASTIVKLNNQVFMLSNQGVVQISLSGVTVISFDIEPPIMYNVLQMSNVSTVAFGVAHESERQYMLWVPSAPGDTYAKEAYVYHAFIQEWTHWTKPAATGIALNSDYRLYLSSGLENAIIKERKNGDYTDYSDEEQPITILTNAPAVLTITWTNTNFTPTAGLTLHQGSIMAKATSVTFVSGSTWQVALDRSTSFARAAATARMPIYSQIRFSPLNCQQVGLLKQFYNAMVYLEADSVTQASLEAGTNEAPQLLTFPITRTLSTGWGVDSWGTATWGDAQSPARSVPWLVDVPVPDHTGETLTAGWYHSVSQEPFVIAQVSVAWDPLTEYEES